MIYRRIDMTVFVCSAILVANSAVCKADLFKELSKLDPTQKDGYIGQATGHTFDPSALIPHVPPPTETRIDDPTPVPVFHRIDARTGDVYERTQNHPWHKTGVKAHFTIQNGVKFWVYGEARERVPDDVDANGITHVFDGTNIFIRNSTNRTMAFRMWFLMDGQPDRPQAFNDVHTLEPGQSASWHLGPTTTLMSVGSSGQRFYKVRVLGFDPASGNQIEDWGPNQNRPGLVTGKGEDGLHQLPQQNGKIHQYRNIVFDLR